MKLPAVIGSFGLFCRSIPIPLFFLKSLQLFFDMIQIVEKECFDFNFQDFSISMCPIISRQHLILLQFLTLFRHQLPG